METNNIDQSSINLSNNDKLNAEQLKDQVIAISKQFDEVPEEHKEKVRAELEEIEQQLKQEEGAEIEFTQNAINELKKEIAFNQKLEITATLEDNINENEWKETLTYNLGRTPKDEELKEAIDKSFNEITDTVMDIRLKRFNISEKEAEEFINKLGIIESGMSGITKYGGVAGDGIYETGGALHLLLEKFPYKDDEEKQLATTNITQSKDFQARNILNQDKSIQDIYNEIYEKISTKGNYVLINKGDKKINIELGKDNIWIDRETSIDLKDLGPLSNHRELRELIVKLNKGDFEVFSDEREAAKNELETHTEYIRQKNFDINDKDAIKYIELLGLIETGLESGYTGASGEGLYSYGGPLHLFINVFKFDSDDNQQEAIKTIQATKDYQARDFLATEVPFSEIYTNLTQEIRNKGGNIILKNTDGTKSKVTLNEKNVIIDGKTMKVEQWEDNLSNFRNVREMLVEINKGNYELDEI